LLEVKNLTKVYKTKGGADTHALDGVSVQFPEKGMVFLLGKSGSGKSTLLNVCGGLDAPTSGEIIVKGRSSKDFTQSDFDSYRNTFIGFIFQEYNILNEFSVEDNIALALELQGKSKDKQAIAQLLEEVDLTGYAKRKPNTLSGGQKQRIAIARALVKAPEIIMADEPTGALDSATGKQVFDTLKKLSQDKLVIVVSHDRDFAELYGDRVIELKDGKIISDVSKTQEEQKALSANVTSIGDTLCVKKGAKLSDKDFEEIRAFLKNTDSDVIIATGEKDVKTFKDVSRITDDGGKEVFRDTDESKMEKKSYRPEESKFIRSKLPMRHAMKIGASGLKTKPFRLIFTVLLSAIAFIMFGLFSTMMLYEKDATLYQSIDDAQPSVLRITKKYRYTNFYESEDHSSSYEDEEYTQLTQAEVDKMALSFGGDTFGVVYMQPSWSGSFEMSNIDFDSTESVGDYYQPKLAFAGYLPEGHTMRSKITTGNYPTADDEVCISSYTANTLVKYKFENVNDINGLIGKTLDVKMSGSSNEMKIVGIFDSNDQLLSGKYAQLQEKEQQPTDELAKLKKQFNAELSDGLHLNIFVTEKTRNAIAARSSQFNRESLLDQITNYKYRLNYRTDEHGSSDARYFKYSELPEGETSVIFSDNSSIGDDEAVVTLYIYQQLLNHNLSEAENLYNEQADQLRANGQPVNRNFYEWFHGSTPEEHNEADIRGKQIFDNILASSAEVQKAYELNSKLSVQKELTVAGHTKTTSISDWLNIANNKYFSIEGGEKEGSENIELSTSDIEYIITQLSAELKDLSVSFMGKAMQVDGGYSAVSRGAKELKVAGILITNAQSNDFIALSDSTYEHFKAISDEENPNYYSSKNWTETKYEKPENAIFNAVYIPYNSSLKGELSMFTFEWAEDDSRYSISHAVGDALELVNGMITELSTIFMWIGIVMAVFAALLLSNFISVSISHKKRDIGILRAVGARSSDVFKIFFSESFFIALISIVISMVGCFVACSIINTEIGSALSGVSLFVFGPMSMLILVGVALVTAVVATFLPVYNAAKKKPVDSIRAIV
jgi:ABC-type lipoprotein export system ATPase subunit